MRALFISLLVLGLAGCLDKEDYPDVPQLEYEYTELFPFSGSPDSVGRVRFHFADGDGDLGLRPGDSTGVFDEDGPYYYNLFVRYFEKRDGQYVEDVPIFPRHSRFSSLTPEGNDKTVEGYMDVLVSVRSGIVAPGQDTFRYEIFIVDRALNHSDTIVTEDLVLPQ